MNINKKQEIAISKLYEKTKEAVISKRYCKRCGSEMTKDRLGYYACWNLDCFKKYL